MVARERTFASDYVLRADATKSQEVEFAKFREEWKDKQKLEIEVQLNKCRELCHVEQEQAVANVREEIASWTERCEEHKQVRNRPSSLPPPPPPF